MSETKFEQFYKDRDEFKSMELTLCRMEDAASEIGINDDIANKIVHIAGTNGKGSTAHFTEQILSHRGMKTACFTSPHIKSVTERIRLNGEDISIDEFDSLFTELKDAIIKHNLSYFEGLTLIAYKYFKDNKPDVAIIETGLGGCFDSTNILKNKIPVITSISKDHVEYLGNDILKIADEKIAIVKNNLIVFLGDNTEYMNKYLDYKLESKTIVRANYSDDYYEGFKPPYSNNLKLAKSVCDFICDGDLPADLKLMPCREERIGQFILDGAHNEDALSKLLPNYSGCTVIFSSTSDRETHELLKIVEQSAENIIITAIPDNERSMDINNIDTSHIKEASPEKAVKIAVELSGNADILVCGSLYLCAHVREILAKGIM